MIKLQLTFWWSYCCLPSDDRIAAYLSMIELLLTFQWSNYYLPSYDGIVAYFPMIKLLLTFLWSSFRFRDVAAMWNDPSSMTTSWNPWLAPPFGPFQWLTTADNPDEALRTLALALRKNPWPPSRPGSKSCLYIREGWALILFQRARLNIKKSKKKFSVD